MSSKRSPILGYNHNVQYRGLVFHIQTEDSGLKAPHVFTHMFHGGVIVSTRKLVYDSGTVEEGIKALMQSQHKAVMKDLRKGAFDAKIDEYLAGTPGLLPAGAAGAVAAGDAAPMPDELALKSTSSKEIPLPSDSGSIASRVDLALASEPGIETPPVEAAAQTAAPLSEQTRRRQIAESVAPLPPAPGRVSTADLADSLSALGVYVNNVEPSRTSTPMRAVNDRTGLRHAGAPPEVRSNERDDVAEIHSSALASDDHLPDGGQPARASEYAQHRRRNSSQIMPMGKASPTSSDVIPRTSRPPTGPRPVERVSAPQSVASARQSGSQPSTTPPGPRSIPPSGAPANASSLPRPRTPTPARVASPTSPGQAGANAVPGQPRRRASTGAGVVMSKPAVVVGAPSRNNPVFQTQTRVRSAREESKPRQQAISERSLDEVILAYLSEDSKNK